MTDTERRLRAEIARLIRENARLFTLLHGRPPRAAELAAELAPMGPMGPIGPMGEGVI